MKKNIAVVVSQTGGHIFPAISIKKKLEDNFNICFITTKSDKKNLYNLQPYYIKSTKWDRSSIFKNLFGLPKLFVGLVQSFIFLKKNKINLVISFGGFSIVPVGLASYFLKIPFIIYESNIYPGLANRFLSNFATKIFVAFDDTKNYFNKKCYKIIEVVGTLVREHITGISKIQARKKHNIPQGRFVILIFGGSQGADFLNRLGVEISVCLKNYQKKIFLIHITGYKKGDVVRENYKRIGFDSLVFDFYEKIGELLNAADLVICRGGASTIAELITLKIPAILIPFPFASDNHQLKNAQWLSSKGCVIYFNEQEENISQKIVDIIVDSLQLPFKLKRMKEYYLQLEVPDASENIKNFIINYFSTNKI